MDKIKIARRIAAMLVVGVALLYLFYEPSGDSNIINQILELLSKRIVSNLGGAEP